MHGNPSDLFFMGLWITLGTIVLGCCLPWLVKLLLAIPGGVIVLTAGLFLMFFGIHVFITEFFNFSVVGGLIFFVFESIIVTWGGMYLFHYRHVIREIREANKENHM